MKIIYSLGLFSFLILASCQKEEITVSGVYELDDGFTVSFDQGAFKIKVAEVNDSRCPTGAMCAVAGTAIVKFVIGNNGEERSFYYPSWEEKEDPLIRTEYGDFMLELKEVNPYPDVANPIEISTVVFELVEL